MTKKNIDDLTRLHPGFFFLPGAAGWISLHA
jgi:hypothetical protein